MLNGFIFKNSLLLSLITIFILCIGEASAQDDLNPIKWSIKTVPLSVHTGQSFKIDVLATIDKGWHLYSIEQPTGGPIPTRITLPENQKFKLAGEIESPLPRVVFDTNFNMDTEFYEREAVFTLPVEISKDASTGKNTLSVTTFYQTCDDKMCLPPKTVRLTAEIEIKSTKSEVNSLVAETRNSFLQPSAKSSNRKDGDTSPNFVLTNIKEKLPRFLDLKGRAVLSQFVAIYRLL